MKIKHLQEVKPWYEPSDRLREKGDIRCEMTREDHGFLCGVIRMKKPKKIVEIGVAEGGTTGVIMNCLAMLRLKSEVYSVDLNERLWHDDSLKTGYDYDRLAELIQESKSVHRFLLGKTIAGQMETIGDQIDMVVIDTTHRLPGEVLDFLVVLPYMLPGAVVVLHDMNLNYMRSLETKREMVLNARERVATKILFMTVVAEKCVNINDNNTSMENIGAFTVGEDTYRYISSLFFALTMTWSYRLGNMAREYRELYKKHYDEECLKWFDLAVASNERMLDHIEYAQSHKEENLEVFYRFPEDRIPRESNIVLYGAGKAGKKIYEWIRQNRYCNIILWVDKNYEKWAEKGLPVETPGILSEKEFDYILVAVEDNILFNEIKKEIAENLTGCNASIIGPVVRW